jgi:hypothetical protein
VIWLRCFQSIERESTHSTGGKVSCFPGSSDILYTRTQRASVVRHILMQSARGRRLEKTPQAIDGRQCTGPPKWSQEDGGFPYSPPAPIAANATQPQQSGYETRFTQPTLLPYRIKRESIGLPWTPTASCLGATLGVSAGLPRPPPVKLGVPTPASLKHQRP